MAEFAKKLRDVLLTTKKINIKRKPKILLFDSEFEEKLNKIQERAARVEFEDELQKCIR